MPDSINPYIAGNPVTGPEMFFGRADVFAFVRQALVGKHRDNVIILFGQRRTGKTSVLYQMSRHLGARYVCVLLDLHGLALEGLDGFLWELANSIARTLRRDYRIELTPPPRAAFQSSPRSQFENVFLNQVWAALGDRHLLLMLDEAIRLQEQVQAGKLEPEVFEYLRYLMQHFPRLNFLFALGDGLEGMTKEYAFLFSVGLYKKISFLERDAALKLITQPVQNSYAVDPAAQARILQITGAHPYYTQLLCHGLFQRWQHTRTSLLGVADIDAVVDEAVERGLAVLKHTWEESSPAEKAVLAGAAAAMRPSNTGTSPGDPTNIKRAASAQEIAAALKLQDIQLPPEETGQAYKSLRARDILTGTDPYRFTVDLQRLWINKYERVEWVRDELAEALKKWTGAARPPILPAPRFSMPEYPTIKTGGGGRRSPNRAWLWGGGIVVLLLFVLAALLGPRFLAGTQQQLTPTQVAVVSPTRTATRPLPTPTNTLPPPTPTRNAAAAETANTSLPEPTLEFGKGVQIVFTRGTPGCSSLGLMNLDDGKLLTFNPFPNNEEPAWSPDGRLFVASTGDCQNTEYRLTMFDAETGETIPIETACKMAIDPDWGDDDRIYFACGSRAGNGQLYSVNPNGTDLRDLGISARRPTLSPDGRYLAYMQQERDDVWRIWVAELNEAGVLVNPKQMPFPQVLGGVFARQPKWNSDGTRLYFNVTDQTSLQAMALASVELATGSTNLSFITPDTNTPFVRPVCGKNNVCVASGANGGLWLLEDVGGALIPKRQLTFGEEYGADVFP